MYSMMQTLYAKQQISYVNKFLKSRNIFKELAFHPNIAVDRKNYPNRGAESSRFYMIIINIIIVTRGKQTSNIAIKCIPKLQAP